VVDLRGSSCVTRKSSQADQWAARRLTGAPTLPQILFDFLDVSRAHEEEERRKLRQVTGRGFVKPVEQAVAEGRHDRALRLMATGALPG